MRHLLLFFALWISFSAWAQNDYTPLKSQGVIPDEFLTMGVVEYHKDKRNIKSKKHYDKKAEADFYLKHNYFINDLFKDGFVLFEDEVSKYINDLGQRIISQVPDLVGDREINFYVVRNQVVNAFSTQKGYLFINLGLIAQCENEAQLSFVIAHELMHYLKDHGVEGYIESKNINRNRDTRNLSNKEKFELYTEYSKDNEFEADLEGLKNIYLKLGYDIEEVLNVFDVLLYSYLPFDEIAFDSAYFNGQYFQLPQTVTEIDVNSITAIEDYDDRFSTHPNIKKRREKMMEELADVDAKPNGVKYLLSKERFEKVRKISRYEICQLYLDDMEYVKAFYSAYLLSREDSNNLYLQRIQAYSIYALSKYYNRLKEVKEPEKTVIVLYGNSISVDNEGSSEYRKMRAINNMFLELDSIEGMSSQFSNMIRKMDRKELNIVAIREIFNVMEKNPNDPYMKLLAKSAIHDLYKKHDIKLDDFLEKPVGIDTGAAPEFVALSDEEYEKLSKYEKIKYNKKKEKFDQTGSTGNYLATAFIKYFQSDESYRKLFKEVKEDIEYEQDESITKEDKKYKSNKYNITEYNSFEKKNTVRNTVMINPSMSYYRNSSYDYIKSEAEEKDFLNAINEVSKSANMKLTLFDSYNFKPSQVDYYNDLGTSTRFYLEFLEHDYLIGSENIICSNINYMKKLSKTYSTDYFAIAGVTAYARGTNILAIYYRIPVNIIFFPYALPRTIFTASDGFSSTYYLYQIVDINTGKVVYFHSQRIYEKSRDYAMRSFLYSSMWSMNNPKAKK